MIRSIFSLVATLLLVTSCVPANNFSSQPGTGTTPTPSGGVISCAAVSGYTSLAACKQSTYAQCTPSTQVINGATGVCYFPVSGWQSCTATTANWVYDTWGAYCRESTGVYKSTRAAMCNRLNAACDCVTDSVTTRTCTTNATSGYTACSFTGSGLLNCDGSATPTPTPVPVAYCNDAVLNFKEMGTESKTVMQEIYNSRYLQIFTQYFNKGYRLMNHRTTTPYVGTAGSAMTNDEFYGHHVIQISAWKNYTCSSSSQYKIAVMISRFKNGVGANGTNNTNSYISGCVSAGTGSGLAMDALLNLVKNTDYCN